MSAETRLVHCKYCHKTHAVLANEEECAPGAWIDIERDPLSEHCTAPSGFECSARLP